MCNVLLAMSTIDERQFLKDMITTHFFNLTFLPDVIDSEAAYRLAKEVQIDIMILDLSDFANLTFDYKTKIIKQQPNVKVILLDNEKNADHLQTALRCSVIDYLVKPLRLGECQTAIHRALVSLNQVSLLNVEHSAAENEKGKNVHKMIQYIHQHYNEKLSLEQLAKLMHLHPCYVSRSFTEVVGMSFVQYLQHYRIEQAKKKLQFTHLPISEIAEQVGYSNSAYFSRVFKRTTTYTPNQYRQTYEGCHVPTDFQHVREFIE